MNMHKATFTCFFEDFFIQKAFLTHRRIVVKRFFVFSCANRNSNFGKYFIDNIPVVEDEAERRRARRKLCKKAL